ncbi:exodeoxyribonuclease V subunit alpha [Prochlorococcus marinus]|uniref:Possible exodeoxyribonuclease V 67 kD polypeptide n=1 Tax=Prochlorococcus marinus (strain MIT 9211) TaxID=93059 RepID=A9BB03_PROM4|nr:exodeoxyribonuclease V subunit alpha [Prochlorococcus marinus]ABX09015.1 possible exodeoxyribonuclease V 67 kD polypeptide [Prochlorococcus marinus str. MIT 9211]
MNKENTHQIKPELKNALAKVLLERIPTSASQPHLQDLINILLESLSRGEIYISLDESKPPTEVKAPGWPTEHLRAIKQSGWLEQSTSPIILENNRLGWYRWDYEMKGIIKDLIKKSNQRPKLAIIEVDKDAIKSTVKLNSEQLLALESITSHNLVLLSGGPGTGKTSTIVEMLRKSLSIDLELRIGLAAPTGKATRRLQESLQSSIEELNPQVKDKFYRIPCLTLHRWLKANERGFSKNETNQLDLDLLVIDEMSMVDISLMRGVLNALPKQSQLVLVGDPNQLPPVGSGAVWNELLKSQNQEILGSSRINLSKVYRNRGQIALLAKMIREDSFNVFWNQIQNLPLSSNVKSHSQKKNSMPSFLLEKLKAKQAEIQKILSNSLETLNTVNTYPATINNPEFDNTIKKLLKTLEELAVLCPRRFGLWSVEHVHQALLGNSLEEGVMHWPEGTPVICGENQQELGLSNGDIGVIFGSNNERRLIFRVITEKQTLEPKLIHPSRLRKVDPAYALTIHKSQGSEVNDVVLLWPDDSYICDQQIKQDKRNENYDKSLMYTALTRAKNKFDLILPEAQSN